MDIEQFWKDVLEQDENALKGYFRDDAVVNWHCTNERFTAAEFIRANCEYPGAWAGEIQRKEVLGELVITVVRVFSRDGGGSFHVVSFIRVRDGKIASMDEYWADDGIAPLWRREMGLGVAIRGPVRDGG